jgi:hypothetical protein
MCLCQPDAMRAFLSSTFCDLRFERRFVISKLEELGFEVVSMESDYKKEFDWRQWSTNQAGQCDVLIFLFDRRVGEQGTLLFGDHIFISISKLEIKAAIGKAIKLLAYDLQRPFPDQQAIFSAEEECKYLKTLSFKDRGGRFDFERHVEGLLREGILIKRVSELERRLELDTRVSWTSYLSHKMRIHRRSYFDANFCAWRHALEDETVVGSTHRLGLSWRLKTPVILSLILLAGLYFVLPLEKALICSALLLLIGTAIFAYLPSFVWVGTKTIIARGAFGRFVQRSASEPFELKPRWALFDDWTGLGALSVHFADGRKVFVPLVNDPTRLAREVAAKLKDKTLGQ